MDFHRLHFLLNNAFYVEKCIFCFILDSEDNLVGMDCKKKRVHLVVMGCSSRRIGKNGRAVTPWRLVHFGIGERGW